VNVNYKKDSEKEISVDKGSAIEKEIIEKDTSHTDERVEEQAKFR
jgi:hypothetical protein